MTEEVRILAATCTGHYLFPEESWGRGLSWNPDAIVAQGTTSDCGPSYLGLDAPYRGYAGIVHGLRTIILSAKRKGIPFILSTGTPGGGNRQLERSLDAAMIRLSEHQRLEPDIVPPYRKEVGLLMENLPMMDEFNPLVIHDLEPGHSGMKYIIIRRLGRTKIRRGSGNPTQIVQDSTKRYIPSWKLWEERTLTQFFDTDIATEERIETALKGLLEFCAGQTRKVKGGKKSKK